MKGCWCRYVSKMIDATFQLSGSANRIALVKPMTAKDKRTSPPAENRHDLGVLSICQFCQGGEKSRLLLAQFT